MSLAWPFFPMQDSADEKWQLGLHPQKDVVKINYVSKKLNPTQALFPKRDFTTKIKNLSNKNL